MIMAMILSFKVVCTLIKRKQASVVILHSIGIIVTSIR